MNDATPRNFTINFGPQHPSAHAALAVERQPECDAVHPALKSFRIAQRPKILVSAQECLLRHVVGVLMVRGHAVRDAIDVPAVALDDPVEGLPLAKVSRRRIARPEHTDARYCHCPLRPGDEWHGEESAGHGTEKCPPLHYSIT